VRNGAPCSVAKGRRGMTNEATPAILIIRITKIGNIGLKIKGINPNLSYNMCLSLRKFYLI